MADVLTRGIDISSFCRTSRHFDAWYRYIDPDFRLVGKN
jgi:hypothetical protein